MAKRYSLLSLVLVFSIPIISSGQTNTVRLDGVDARADSAEFARQLGHADPLVRQNAAEALARLVAVDQLKMVQGYHVQEKNKNVRLALDWALYRMGKQEALYRIVHELDSSRHDQSVGYLKQLEGPAPLHPLLKQTGNPGKITVGLLEALAQLGDGDTLELIKPLRDSFVAGVAEAAEVATDTIESRLAPAESSPASDRPRIVSKPLQTSP
jgi:HEAT repeat protein